VTRGLTMPEKVSGFERPASLGGPTHDDENTLTIRWYGTTNFELEFRGQVLLLDNFYDRGPRTPSAGFRADAVERADLILVGHPHYDHIADTATVSERTGARVLVAPIGADLLVEQGLSAGNIESTPGTDDGDLFELDGFSVRVLHAIHMQPDPGSRGFQTTASAWDDMGPLSAEEDEELKQILARGSWAEEVFTEGTLCFIVDIDGFRLVFRDSAGPFSVEEQAWFAAHPGSDLAIVAYAGRPVPRWQAEQLTLPLVQHYEPQLVVPCHHDELYPYFLDLSTEPLRRLIRAERPGSDLLAPTYVEPVRVNLKSVNARLGD
jgi:L-ascorbate metabolism protein UlaG (beta-lactamase superfamily)